MSVDDGAATVEDEARGLAEAEVRLDPWGPLQRFSRKVGRGVRIWFDGCPIVPIKPLDTGVDRRIDLDALAKKSQWVGGVKMPRVKTAEEYPLALEEQMRDVERQFILRNLDRYEMAVDLDEPLPLDKTTVEYANIEAAMSQARDYEHKAPELLEFFLLDAVKDELRWRHRYTHVLRWSHAFGAEVKKHITGPVWKYDSDAPETAHLARAIADEIAGRVRPPEDEPPELGA